MEKKEMLQHLSWQISELHRDVLRIADRSQDNLPPTITKEESLRRPYQGLSDLFGVPVTPSELEDESRD